MKANDLRAASGSFADFLHRSRKIFLRIRRAFHLHEPNGEFACHGF